MPDRFPALSWPLFEDFTQDQLLCNGNLLTYDLSCELGKNPISDGSDWIMYRRNKFEVSIRIQLHPFSRGGATTFQGAPVRGFGLDIAGLSAEGPDLEKRQSVGVYQCNTNKRLVSERRPLGMISIMPTAPGYALAAPREPNLQTDMLCPWMEDPVDDWFVSCLPAEAAVVLKQLRFDRSSRNRTPLRRHRICVGLFADIAPEDASAPHWVQLCQRLSDPIKVRSGNPEAYKLPVVVVAGQECAAGG
ncbi:hypothetical protein ANO11243_067720 [Dothideomycetidae sp. 11243]|nr:hypothetical protein ANO11243_067720 [fungal sp. No.11243]